MVPRVVAEIGLANNSIEWAHTAVESAADAGCWGLKVQMLTADTLTAKDAPRYERLGTGTQHDGFRDALPHEAWHEVFQHAWDLGLEAFASVWDRAAIDILEEWGVRYYKVGSADITHHTLLEELALTDKHVILSTGASTWNEVDTAAGIFGWAKLTLLACTLSYPCASHDARLERILWLLYAFFTNETEVGYSDHTQLVDISGLAVAAGATMLEKHFTVTPGVGGDHDFALDPEQMRQYVKHAERAWMLYHHDTPIGEPLPAEEDARLLARRSLHTTEPVERGDELELGVNCEFLRPALDGIPADDAPPWRLAGRDLPSGHRVRDRDLAD